MVKRDTPKSVNQNRVALVTGGATRLGRQIALTLHEAGFDICVHCNNSVISANTLVEELNSSRPESAFSIVQDLTMTNFAENITSMITVKKGRLDLLVNNASIFNKTSIATHGQTLWDQTMSTNAKAPYYLSLSSANLLRKNSGSIVNISDIHGERPRLGYSSYCISKATLDAVTKSLAIELAPEVRVNSVAPGAIIWADSEETEERTEALSFTPLKRTGEPSDIAKAVLYLAESAYVTGQILRVDGGRALNV